MEGEASREGEGSRLRQMTEALEEERRRHEDGVRHREREREQQVLGQVVRRYDVAHVCVCVLSLFVCVRDAGSRMHPSVMGITDDDVYDRCFYH